jgi:VIT1/CCC1 family predicted Fe2+/Mn2+ transporter
MATPPIATGPASQTASALRVVGEYRKHALDPVDRFSEVIFGLIMVLAFTCSMSVADGGSQDVHKMLVAALACNVAWGIVDGVMYVLTSIAERARRVTVFHGIRSADPGTARAIVLGAVPEGMAAITDQVEADRIVARIRALPGPSTAAGVNLEDLRGALGSALLVVIATLPPTLPFLFMGDAGRALRVSNAVAVGSLFLAGYWLGRATGVRAWLLGLAMVVVGSALVALTVSLGG